MALYPLENFELTPGGFRCKNCHTQFCHGSDANKHNCEKARELSKANLKPSNHVSKPIVGVAVSQQELELYEM